MGSDEFMKNKQGPIKVMIVDDSAVIRGVLSKFISEDQEIEVIYSAYNANLAIDFLKKTDVEVVMLDVEMPGTSGLEAITPLLKIKPSLKIMMVSTLTSQNAPSTLKALSLGAADYIEKPSASQVGSRLDFKDKLLGKIKVLGYAARNMNTNVTYVSSDIVKIQKDHQKSGEKSQPKFLKSSDIVIRRERPLNFKPSLIAIASSTGGPKAVSDLLLAFKAQYLSEIPVVITQHMQAFFTKLFAENISKLGRGICTEAIEGEEVKGGKIYLAPGGNHLLVSQEGTKKVIRLSDGPPVNFCKPAADPMLDSLCEIYKNKLLVIVLTGMGSDGLAGSRKVVEKGGVVIAQDEQSSVVWGMPGNVAVNNLCSAVLPINEIAEYIMQRGK